MDSTRNQITGRKTVANVDQRCRQCKACIAQGATFVHVAEPAAMRANLCLACTETLLARGAGRFVVVDAA